MRGGGFRTPRAPDCEDVSSGLRVLAARLVGADPPQDAPGGSSKLQEAPGSHRRLRRLQEATIDSPKTPQDAQNAQEFPGCSRRLQESSRRPQGAPGCPRKSGMPQEAPGGPKKFQEAPGSARRPQKTPGGPRRSQKVPGSTRKLRNDPNLKCFTSVPIEQSFSCGSNPMCVTYVIIDWASCGARVLGVLRVFL